jgi:hypothetical protein
MLNHELYEQLSEDFNDTIFSSEWDNSETANAKFLFNELLNLEASLLNKWDAQKEVVTN